jgi:GH24 family phage-related lysozyme (muramidase)
MTKLKPKSYEDAVSWFREHGFDVLEAPGAGNRVFLKKYRCSAAIERTEDGGVKVFAYPGYLMHDEISKLVDQGYQKVLKTTKAEYPATAEHLKALHQFTEELKEGIGGVSLYNEGLGTVSESYRYDRVRGRDLPEAERPQRPWQAQAKDKRRA